LLRFALRKVGGGATFAWGPLPGIDVEARAGLRGVFAEVNQCRGGGNECLAEVY
jgi:hypothetical protein